MAVERMSSVPFSSIRPTPKVRTSDKLIFISCEGSNTEWDYFEKVINSVYSNIRTKVKVYNVLEDILNKAPNKRTEEEKKLINSSNPANVLQKMTEYLEKNADELNLSAHKDDDEFWLILDVDKNTDKTKNVNGKSRYNQWISVLSECKEKNYSCAISNPFFELWLLLHFDDVNEDDFSHAVTETSPYVPTDHFRNRLKQLNIPLSGKHQKNIGDTEVLKYTKDKIKNAISRAINLDVNPENDYPQNLGTTVYKLVNSIVEIDEQYEDN